MIWLNPFAWLAVAAVAVPILVHLLAHRRAARMPFPTLRFVPPTRLAAIRRRALEDRVLLAIRSMIVAAAVAALAGPLILTSSRRAAWNARLVRALVVSSPVAGTLVAQGFSPAIAALKGCATPDCHRFETMVLSDGIHRASAWLASAPPARRELVIAAPLTIGSITHVDLAAVPLDVGIRFTRTEDVPAVRRVQTRPLLTRTGTVRRTVTLAGRITRVSEEFGDESAPWPIEIVATRDLQNTADAALAAVRSQHVRQPAPDHRGRLILLQPVDADTATSVPPGWDGGGDHVRQAWMADAIARMARDDDLRAEAARTPAGLVGDRFAQIPWHVLARAADGRAVASAAASSQTLLVAAASRRGDLIVPVLLRAFANSLTPETDLGAAETVQISDEQLRAWSRPPGSPAFSRVNTVDQDDRRWLWVAVLLLLIVETWIRRARRENPKAIEQEAARVA